MTVPMVATKSEASLVSRLNEIPRTTTAALLLAIGANGWTALQGLVHPQYMRSWQWALMAAACCLVMAAAIARPHLFRLREFRLPGVAVTSLSLLILVPLPGLVIRHDNRLPAFMVATIAGGLVAFSLVVLVVPAHKRSGPVAALAPRWEQVLPDTIVFVGVIVLPIWVRSIGSIPILQLITGTASGLDISLARQDALSGLAFVPLRLLVGALRNTYLMFAAGWFIADTAITRTAIGRTRLKRRALVAVALSVAVVYAVITTERAIVGQVGIAAVVAWMIASRRQLSSRLVVWLVGLGVAFPFVFGVLNSAGSLGQAVESVRRRIFYVPGDVMVEYFLSFPRRRPFLEGRSLPKVPRLFGQEPFDLSGYIYDAAYKFDSRLAGSANGSFIGVGWANFGWSGVLVWCAATALALIWLERTIATMPRRTSAALRGVAVVQVVLLTSADVTRTILNVAPGFLDLVVGAAILSAVFRQRVVKPPRLSVP